MKKEFHNTQISQLWNLYSQDMIRSPISSTLIFRTINYFNFKNILEIGFFEGYTFGIMLESCMPGSSLTTLDIDFKMNLYNLYYKDTAHTKDKNIRFINSKSNDHENFLFGNEKPYDCILVDANADYDGYLHDLLSSVNSISENGIIIADHYKLSNEVDMAIDDFLKLDHNFVPFMCDGQALFFHHKYHNCATFLDEFVTNTFQPMCTTFNLPFKNCIVKHIEERPVLVCNNLELYKFYCKLNNI